MITKPTNFVTRHVQQRLTELTSAADHGDLCPDLTAEMLEFLEARFKLPTWDGQEHTRAEYHRDVGKYQLVVDLRANFEAYT